MNNKQQSDESWRTILLNHKKLKIATTEKEAGKEAEEEEAEKEVAGKKAEEEEEGVIDRR